MTDITPKLLRVHEAATYLGLGRRTIWRLVHKGLKKIKIGKCTRFAVTDLDDFIGRNR